jgi:hypothetical protein
MSRRTPTLLQALLAIACGASLSVGAFAGGCDEAPPIDLVGGFGGGGAGGAGGSGGNIALTAEELFAEIEGDLIDKCGGCHMSGGIANTPFLQSPDYYQSVRSWPGVVKKDPLTSSFLTYANGTMTPHSGPELDSIPGLTESVTAWLTEESKGIVVEEVDAGPSIEPIAPILGFNALYLDALGDDFVGMALTFKAAELTPNALELTNLQLYTTVAKGLHIVHPVFVVHPVGKSPDPDPVDSFSGLDLYVEPGQTSSLGPGMLILTNWKPGARLSIAFETISPWDGMAMGEDGGSPLGGGCKDVQAFIDSAQGPLGACSGCHGGGNQQAAAALDMTKLNSDAPFACGQVRNRVDPANPGASQIFVNTDPNGGAAHPFKFNGNGQNWQNFVNSVSTWVAAEN